VFGGTNSRATSETVEQYCVSTDKWTMLKILLPNPISFQVSFKLSESQIILLGGSIKTRSGVTESYKSNQVLIFDVMKPKFTRCRNLAKDVLSLYPAFYDENSIYLVDEDENSENPLVVRYDLSDKMV
jgi:hypothetical protein